MNKSGMACQQCKCFDTKLLETRKRKTTIRRRRGCNLCGHRWTTHEKIVTLKQPEKPSVIPQANILSQGEEITAIELSLNREAALELFDALASFLVEGKADSEVITISVKTQAKAIDGLVDLTRSDDEKSPPLPR